jgi:hypothetical protein
VDAEEKHEIQSERMKCPRVLKALEVPWFYRSRISGFSGRCRCQMSSLELERYRRRSISVSRTSFAS